MNDETKKPSFEMSIDTRMVYDRFKEAREGDVVSFKQLEELLGKKVAGANSNIQSAVRRLLKVDGIVFYNVRGVGYKRLADVEIVATAEPARERLRRGARKAVRVLTSVQNFGKLPNDAKVKHNAAVSGFGAIAHALTPSSMRKLEQSVEKARDQLPLAKTLEAFKG